MISHVVVDDFYSQLHHYYIYYISSPAMETFSLQVARYVVNDAIRAVRTSTNNNDINNKYNNCMVMVKAERTQDRGG